MKPRLFFARPRFLPLWYPQDLPLLSINGFSSLLLLSLQTLLVIFYQFFQPPSLPQWHFKNLLLSFFDQQSYCPCKNRPKPKLVGLISGFRHDDVSDHQICYFHMFLLWISDDGEGTFLDPTVLLWECKVLLNWGDEDEDEDGCEEDRHQQEQLRV